MPFVDPAMAVEFVAEHSPEIPFWPQLPSRAVTEAMMIQSLPVAWPGLRRVENVGLQVDEADLDSFEQVLASAPAGLDDDKAAGFSAFCRAAEAGAFSEAVMLKGQLTGPITLARFVICRDEPLIRRPRVVDALARWVSRQATWQVQVLRSLGLPVLMFVDEPALSLTSRFGAPGWAAGVLRKVCDAIRQAGAVPGVHCCAVPVDFGVLWEARPDVVSFDGRRGAFTREAVRCWTEGGSIAFGVAPTGSQPAHTPELLQRWRAGASLCGDPVGLARRTLITATCGLGLSDPVATQASFRVAAEVGGMIRHIALSPAGDPS